MARSWYGCALVAAICVSTLGRSSQAQQPGAPPAAEAPPTAAALEARIETPLLGGAIEVVPFIDAGTVALGSTPDFRFIQAGAGVGIRYKTTFGPIRVDVATPLNPTQFDGPLVVYVSLGQAF